MGESLLALGPFDPAYSVPSTAIDTTNPWARARSPKERTKRAKEVVKRNEECIISLTSRIGRKEGRIKNGIGAA